MKPYKLGLIAPGLREAQEGIAMDVPKPILCAECSIVPGNRFERDGTPWSRCPESGQEARVSDIQCEAIEQHIDRVIRTERSAKTNASYRWILSHG